MIARAVMGIDPSLVGTAVALAMPGAPAYEHRYKTKPAVSVRDRVMRYRSIVLPVVELAIAKQPALVLVEGYAFSRAGTAQSGRSHDRAELGGILRDRMLEHCGELIEVPPSTLKKWACGKGNADKGAVISALSRRYNREFANDDQADAWALMTLGLALTGQSDPETKAQREVIEAIRDAA